ncbi:MAG: hypothetical protein QG670_2287, partial [Thermoproteota archaeon]|nr:hypothetical protein [Thermoproteota archaeon]
MLVADSVSEDMSSRVGVRLISVLVDLFPFLEPFVPPFISLYLTRLLGRWKELGLISDYNKSVRRLGKPHYEVSIALSLTQKQVNGVLRRASGVG